MPCRAGSPLSCRFERGGFRDLAGACGNFPEATAVGLGTG